MLDVDTGGVIERRVYGFSDIAILYRTHRQAQLLEKCLKKEGIPYIVTGREDYLSHPSVKGTLSFFRHLLHPEDTSALALSQRHLEPLRDRDVLETLTTKYTSRVKRTKPQKLIDSWIQDLGLSEDEFLCKFSNMAVFHPTMQSLLDTVTFGQESDLKRSWGKGYTSGAVTLMTLHAAKGLEYPAVFLAGLNKGILPLSQAREEAALEEERRLFYVGLTRAKEELVLITAAEKPSPFIEDIPEKLVQRERIGKEKEDGELRQISLFEIMKEM